MLLIGTLFIGLVGTVSATPPSTPDQPKGPVQGGVHILYEFRVSPAYAYPSDHQLYYLFDWDDTTSSIVGPFDSGKGPVVASHTWTAVGVYDVTVQAIDATTSEFSPESEPWAITIHLLETPKIDEAPTVVGIGQLAEFSVSAIQAPFNHEVWYVFDWDDGYTTGWLGPYPSSWDFPIEASHEWTAQGTYGVRVKAKDATTGDESEWSAPWEIAVGMSEGPLFSVVGLSGGFGVTAYIENLLAPSKYVDYSIEISGGAFSGVHVQRHYEGTVYIPSGSTVSISTPLFFSLGRVKVTVTATAGGEPVATGVYEAMALFVYVTNIQEV